MLASWLTRWGVSPCIQVGGALFLCAHFRPGIDDLVKFALEVGLEIGERHKLVLGLSEFVTKVRNFGVFLLNGAGMLIFERRGETITLGFMESLSEDNASVEHIDIGRCLIDGTGVDVGRRSIKGNAVHGILHDLDDLARLHAIRLLSTDGELTALDPQIFRKRVTVRRNIASLNDRLGEDVGEAMFAGESSEGLADAVIYRETGHRACVHVSSERHTEQQ